MKELIKYLSIFIANTIVILVDIRMVEMYYLFDFKNTFLLICYILLAQSSIYINYIALTVNYKEVKKLYDKL